MSELVDELRAVAGELDALLGEAAAKGILPGVADKVRETTAAMENRLERGTLQVAVVAKDEVARRAFINAIVGEELLSSDARSPRDARIVVRHATSAGYRARLHDGRVIEFAEALPDRDDAFGKAVARANEAVDAAAKTVAERKTLRDETASVALRQALPTDPAINISPRRRASFVLIAVWRWIVTWFGGLFGASPKRLEAKDVKSPTTLLVAEELAVAENRLAQALEHVERLSEERAKYTSERRAEFFGDVRSLSDAAARGIEVVELSVELPCRHLPPGFALVDAQTGRAGDVAACIVVGGEPYDDEAMAALTEAFRPVVPRFVGGAVSLQPTLDRARAEWADLSAARAATELLGCIRDARAIGVRTEIESRARVVELERQRLPDPVTFRRALLEELAPAVEQGARDVRTMASEVLRSRFEELKREWTEAIEAGSSRSEVEACVGRLKETAPATFSALLDKTGDEVMKETQRISETLQSSAIEKVRAQYKSHRAYQDEASPVVVEMPEAVGAIGEVPLGTALESFEKRRVEVGIGGAATGALLGTAILPGIGTAIGAIIGVFAGFVEGVTSLKALCVGKAQEHLAQVESQIAAHVEKSMADLPKDLRGSVDAMLDDALGQRERSIARLIDIEGKVLARENEKLSQVVDLLDRLRKNEERLGPLTAFRPDARERAR